MPGRSAQPYPGSTKAAMTQVRDLLRHREARDESGLYVVEGVRNFVRCVDHRVDVHSMLISRRLLQSTVAQKLVRRLRQRGVPCQGITPEQFRNISTLDRASGIAAIVRMQTRMLKDVVPQRDAAGSGTWIAVEGVRSAGNLGTLMRTGQAVGAEGLIVTGSADPYAPGVVRAAMGALVSQRIIRSNTAALGRWARQHHCSVLGACPQAVLPYDQATYRSPCIIMLGDERCGLSGHQRSICTATIRIPMRRGCDSLNVGVAGSVLLFEATRSQRRRGS